MPFTNQSLNGVRVRTADDMILDAGVLYYNINEPALMTATPDPFGAAIAGAHLLGATRDGSSFKSGRTVRQVMVDGLRGRIKGMERIDAWEPSLTTNLVEHNLQNVLGYFGGADNYAGVVMEMIQPRLFIENTDYINNVALFATVNGSNEPICLVLTNVLNISAFEFGLKDKSELAVQVTFTASFDPGAAAITGGSSATGLTLVPCRMYLPAQLQIPLASGS